MPSSYSGLSPAQVTLARGLLTSPRWTWGAHTVALRPDGAIVELLPGRAMSREQALQQGLVPLITDPIVLAHLLTLLETACGEAVTFTLRRQVDPEGQISFACDLEAGAHRRSWEGSCAGEAVALALVARWRALEQARAARDNAARGDAKKASRQEATGWAAARMAAAVEARGPRGR